MPVPRVSNRKTRVTREMAMRRESPEHREYVKQLVKHLRSKMTCCPICVIDGLRGTDHDCLKVINLNYCQRPYGKDHLIRPDDPMREISIVYPCYRDHGGYRHLYTLPWTAFDLKEDSTVPNAPTRARPDIAVYDDLGGPLCFIEVKWKSYNRNVKELAERMEIPLFIVEPANIQDSRTPLHKTDEGLWTRIRGDEESRQVDDWDRRTAESMARDGKGASALVSCLADGTEVVDYAFGKLEGRDPVGFQGGFLSASRAFNVGPCPRQEIEVVQ